MDNQRIDDEFLDLSVSKDPDLEAELHIGLLDGLERGDLAPLARVLRSEFEIDEHLRHVLADAIEGLSTVCKISARRVQRGKPDPEKKSRMERNRLVAAFYNFRNQAGGSDAAVIDTCVRFELSRSTVLAAIRDAKAQRERLPAASRIYWDRGQRNALKRFLDQTSQD